MTSLFNGATKVNNNDVGYYINVGSLVAKINGATLNSDGVTYTLSTATWCNTFTTGNSVLGNLSTAGAAVLKDMGKTVTSSLRTFRKIQLLKNSSSGPVQSTFGVGGAAGTSDGEDYYTGYIELGFEGNGVPAPVAHFGR